MADEKQLASENSAEDVSSDNAKAKKSEKPAKKKGPRFGPAVKKFFRDLKGEFKKIIWPTRHTVMHNTLVTIAMCVVIGAFVSLFDFGLSALIRLMLSL